MERVELIEAISQAVNGKGIGETGEGKNLFHYLLDRLWTQNYKHYRVSSEMCQDIISLTTRLFFPLVKTRNSALFHRWWISRTERGTGIRPEREASSSQDSLHTQSQNHSQLGSIYHNHSICCHVFKRREETRKLAGSNSSLGANQQSWSCEAWHAAMLIKEVINGIIKTQATHLIWLHTQKEVIGWDNCILGLFFFWSC